MKRPLGLMQAARAPLFLVATAVALAARASAMSTSDQYTGGAQGAVDDHYYGLRPGQTRLLRETEEIWSGDWTKKDFGAIVRQRFDPDGEWCFGECYRGHAAIENAMREHALLVRHLKVTATEVFPGDSDNVVAARWVDGIVCYHGPDKVHRIDGTIYIVRDPASGKILKEYDTFDGDELARALSECSGGVPAATLMPRIDKAAIDRAVAEDKRRWEVLFAIGRVPDDQLDATVAKFTDRGYEFCTNGAAGCVPQRAFGGMLAELRSLVVDMNLDTAGTRYVGEGQAFYNWHASYKCRFGGGPMSLGGFVHLFFDPATGRHLRSVDVWNTVEGNRQLGACKARAADHSDL